MRPLQPRTKSMLLSGVAVAVFVSVAAILSTPPDEKLGTMVRFVMFHGASTWVNMGTFTLAGVFSLLFLFGVKGAHSWGEALRWVSLPLWIINSILGLLSMQLIWGGILWSEPRLAMTFGILGGALAIFAAQMLLDSPKVPAALDAVLATTLWGLVLFLPNLFHPDSPVFQSGNWAFIGGFLGMVAGIALATVCLTILMAKRSREDGQAG